MTTPSGTAAEAHSVRSEDVPFRQAEIDLAQLTHNVTRFLNAVDGAPICADLGANAWGHGVAIVVPAMLHLGVQAFAVARVDEAVRMRRLAPDAAIVTTQHAAAEAFESAAVHDLTPAVRSQSECERAIAAGVRSIVLVPDDSGGMPALTPDQLAACAAAAAELGVEVRTDLAFAGPELLGVAEDDGSAARGYRPVMRLWAPVAATKRVGADEGVSYGYTYRTSGPTTLALVTLGYADGISRSGGNRVRSRICGNTHPVAGRVAMDAFMVDLGDVDPPALGTEATILGDATRGEPTALEQGLLLGMSSAEMTTRLTARPRRYGSKGAR